MIVPLLRGLGSYHRAISTKNPTADRCFDQGIRAGADVAATIAGL